MTRNTKLPDALADLLTRVSASGLTDKQIHERAGLASGWLSGARNGRYSPEAQGWKKLATFMRRLDSGASKPRTVGGEPEFEEKPTTRDGVSIPPELAGQFASVEGAEELLQLDKRIAELTARGEIDPRLSEVLQAWSRELRQVLELRDEHQAREELLNLVPMTADQAESFWNAQEAKGVKPLAPGECAPPPT